ncbi:MAG: extracellular solute-binding protein [Saccharofermentanales bacterium]
MRRFNKIVAAITIMMILSFQLPTYAQTETDSSNTGPVDSLAATNTTSTMIRYKDYISTQVGMKWVNEKVELNASDAFPADGAVLENNDGTTKINLQKGSSVKWTFDIKEEGLYDILVNYLPIEMKGLKIELCFMVDGSFPYYEATSVYLNRIFKDKSKITRDNNDNDIRPDQTEVFRWDSIWLKDFSGNTDNNLSISLNKGQHTFSIKVLSEALSLSSITLGSDKQIPPYDDYIKNAGSDVMPSETFIITQAEVPYEKSSPLTVPSSYSKIRLNTLGQMNWKFPGQWVSWKINVEKSGYYRLAFKYRQNYYRGFSTSRKIYVNGKIPFQEAQTIEFPYNNDFEFKTLGVSEDNPYFIYLNSGENDIRLEVVIGSIGDILDSVNDTIYRLNEMYRKIIMITGTQPDLLRDYYLEKEIPGLLDTFRECSRNLKNNTARLNKDGKEDTGGQAAFFLQMARQLDSFIDKPDTIQSRLDQYRLNISSLASLTLSFKEQPLELDYITVSSADMPLPRTNANIFETVRFRFMAFIASFFEDYNAVGNTYTADNVQQKPIEVWVSANDLANSGVVSGRDQMTVIKRLIDNEFVKNKGVFVNLRLVDSSTTLIQAILGGTGPDVAMVVPSGTCFDLSMRGALQDLSVFADFEEVKNRFYESSVIPFKFQNGVYGIPETQTYSMMFYRTDIFEELEISPPETWDDFFNIIPIIQRNNLQAGLPESLQLFESLLMQGGGTYYNSDLTATGFDSIEALKAFTSWTDFYVRYSFPMNFDANTRFRTGEMPIVMMPFTFYNLLSVSAPEIKNKWEMVPIPGVVIDGRVRHIESSSGTGSIILKSAVEQDKCFEFVKWWVSADIQARFGTEIEAQMGPAARYNTANVEAFTLLPWSAKEQESLKLQWQEVVGIPNAPGNYYVARSLVNAFRRVTFYYENPREVLNRYNNDMNNEIARKRAEFKLD